MFFEMEAWKLETVDEKEDLHILAGACSRNDEIANVIKQKYEPIRKKMPPPQFIQLTRSYLVDTKKTHFSVLEKYAYDIAMFQLTERNIPMNDNIYIQVCFKSGKTDMIRELHVDWFPTDKNESRITQSYILYLNDSKRPSIFTDITMEEHNAYNFENQKHVYFSFPKPLKLISFDGKKYFHGYYDIFEECADETDRPMIILKVWECKTRPLIDYFDATLFSMENSIPRDSPSRIEFIPHKKEKHISLVDDELIYSGLFENLLFYPKKTLFYPFANLIRPCLQKDDIIILTKGPKKTVRFYNYYWLALFICSIFLWWALM
jgi:hypothetical protein